ncbi:PREDICTED: sperm-associated antigen 4 protein-like [Chrysochloris asiatica]|uniref:Sperm-associated antigen 4 protein-like n=1 Tax=Chrysochloris asiatica TaxID=185453 RepID=A0A9B0WSX8_CHRAS|nr:PREDICTED: sperm-associated antigen 4 protein-like [Chrysochloris asiatica]
MENQSPLVPKLYRIPFQASPRKQSLTWCDGSRRSTLAEGVNGCCGDFGVREGEAPSQERPHRPRPGSTATPQKYTPNLYNKDYSSVSATSGVEPGVDLQCARPQWSPWALAEPAGSPVVPEEQLDLLPTVDLSQEMPTQRVSKSFLSQLFQVLNMSLSLVGHVLVSVYREVCSIRFLLMNVWLLSLFLAALWWGLLYLVPPLENEPKEMLTMREYHELVRCQGQQLQQLQAELDELHKEVSSIRAANKETVAKLVFQRLSEDFVRKPDYALSSVGASIDLEKTSHDYEDTDTAYFWNRFSFWNYARPPTVILEPDVFPGNCWAFEGDQGQVVIRLPGSVQLSDITLQHPPPSVAHSGGANSAPRDFAVYGLQADDKTEVFLGKFTFDVEKSGIQTFHLQNDPPAAFPKVKIQILSNWGHPRFTCLYRVRAHGEQISERAGDSTTKVTGGLH